ncbi:MAG: hypothetical protein DRP79_10080 [Planctomycetota bacterium]|nr:MAG: hypothetical protein DRP79_10080 [Planctomycetota bacterium]
MRERERRYRSSRIDRTVELPRGIFGGNKSVKYGLLVVFLCVLVIEFYNTAQQKHLTGPIDDIFRRDPDNLIIVYPTRGSDSGLLREYAHKVSALLGKKLKADILVYPDSEIDEEILKNYSLILYGPAEQNLVSVELKEYFPFRFKDRGVYLGETYYDQKNWRLVFIVPNPYNEKHYVLVYTGPTAKDVVGINFIEHPNFTRHDKTDYVFAVGRKIVEQGFFEKKSDSRWVLAR